MSSNSIDKWPIVWRVVMPQCGAYDHDCVFLETEDEHEARARLRSMRKGKYPVRLERVHCGPLPTDSKPRLAKWRDANLQIPDTSLRDIAGYWEAQP
jgi:hypothetical protein